MHVQTGPAESPSGLALLTPAEMAEADSEAVRHGVPGRDLMDNAGRAVAAAVARHWDRRPVTILCGPGNNGGDGFVIARYLSAEGWPVRVGLLGDREALKGDAAFHAALWRGPVEPLSPSLLPGAGLVVDAIFGAGLSRPVEGLARQVIEALIARGTPVCAVDVPSGLDGATGQISGIAPQAEITVTFFRKKPGHVLFPGRALCGRLIVADIGIPGEVLDTLAPEIFENGPPLWLHRYPWPTAATTKDSRGHALVVGSRNQSRRGLLAARSAARIGAGRVTLAAPWEAWLAYAARDSGVTVTASDGMEALADLLHEDLVGAVVLDCELEGEPERTRRFFLEILNDGRSGVLDGQALHAFAGRYRQLAQGPGPCILTPNEKEFQTVFDFGGDKLARAGQAAKASGAVIVLKGADTVIAAPDGRAVINSNAPPDLATEGTGSVLTGFIAGLLAQGCDSFDAAAAAVWLHAEAAAMRGPGLIAEDLPDRLPDILKTLRPPA